MRRLWKLPNTTHCKLLSTINSSLPIEIALEKRCAKFIHSCSYSVQNMLLVYKAFTNGSPTYLADMMTSCNPVRSTRSSHKVNLLVVPHQKSNKYSEKAFAVVGPRLWNELLTDELRGCNSVDTFKKKLKTMLFKKHY